MQQEEKKLSLDEIHAELLEQLRDIGYSYVSFLFVRSFRARFFYRTVRKKPLAPCAGASLHLSMV